MNDDFSESKQILKKYNQEHLLNFYEELTEDYQKKLLAQILHIDFENILNLYRNSFIERDTTSDIITPLPYIDKSALSEEELNYYSKLGTSAIQSNEFAVITLAGGQGTRLRSLWT